MVIAINIYYTGEGNNAKKFADEMVSCGVVDEDGIHEVNMELVL